MISDEFAELLVATFNDPDAHPVHVLFNQWWAHAPAEVKDGYVQQFMDDPELAAFVDEGHYAAPLDLEELRALPDGSLGRTFHDWIVDNDLAAQIAMDYRRFHDYLEAQGQLEGMPEAMKYAVLRGFQTHDFQHLITGYDASGRGEIALQAFCLAQLRFPYFGMWISVVTTRMTFVDPRMITPLMDAITEGWQRGRRTPNLQCVKWETMLDQPLSDLRNRYGLSAAAATSSPGAG